MPRLFYQSQIHNYPENGNNHHFLLNTLLSHFFHIKAVSFFIELTYCRGNAFFGVYGLGNSIILYFLLILFDLMVTNPHKKLIDV